MKKTLALSCSLLVLSTLAQAQEVGQVLSCTPVYQQVASPRQSCTQTHNANAPTSGAGAFTGAMTGALLGTLIGDGPGPGMVLGAIGGALLGDKAESDANSRPQTTCTTQTVLENRLIGYNVTYEYAGKSYTVQLPQDPGPTLALQITPANVQATSPAPVLPSAPAPAVVSPPAVVYPAPPVVYTTPAPVVYAPPPVVYAPRPYYQPWPISTSIILSNGGHRHHHWR